MGYTGYTRLYRTVHHTSGLYVGSTSNCRLNGWYFVGSPVPNTPKKHRKVNCLLTKNMKENHEMWVAKIQEEEQQKVLSEKLECIQQQVCIVIICSKYCALK